MRNNQRGESVQSKLQGSWCLNDPFNHILLGGEVGGGQIEREGKKERRVGGENTNNERENIFSSSILRLC